MNLKSRKFWFSILTSALIVASWVSMGVIGGVNAIASQYGVCVGGLLGVLGMYTGGNVSSKWVTKKNEKAPPKKAK